MTRLIELLLRHVIRFVFPESWLKLVLMPDLFSIIRDSLFAWHGKPIVSAPKRVAHHLIVTDRLEDLLIKSIEVLSMVMGLHVRVAFPAKRQAIRSVTGVRAHVFRVIRDQFLVLADSVC